MARSSVVGALAGGGGLGLVSWVWWRVAGSEGLAWGDVRLIAMIGAFVGALPGLLVVLLLASFAGALGGIVSGSGPSFAFLARDEDQALDIATALSGSGTCDSVIHASGPAHGAL